MFAGNWNSTANQNRVTRLTQFVSDFLSSRYMNILSQYGCGTNGTLASTITVATPNNNLSAADIHNLIQNAINNNQIPEPTNLATCVLLYLDDLIAVNDAASGAVLCEAASDNAFGYHDHFVTTAGNTCPFAVQEQRQTQVSSHELSEMFSNPQVGSNGAWSSQVTRTRTAYQRWPSGSSTNVR